MYSDWFLLEKPPPWIWTVSRLNSCFHAVDSRSTVWTAAVASWNLGKVDLVGVDYYHAVSSNCGFQLGCLRARVWPVKVRTWQFVVTSRVLKYTHHHLSLINYQATNFKLGKVPIPKTDSYQFVYSTVVKFIFEFSFIYQLTPNYVQSQSWLPT